MGMTKKDFITLADGIRMHQFTNWKKTGTPRFTLSQIEVMADALAAFNPRFMRERWIGYVNGLNGSNGGKL